MTDHQSEPRLDECRRVVQERLARVRRRTRAHLLVEGLAWCATAVVALGALSLGIDLLTRPELPARGALLAIGGGLFVFWGIRILRPMLLPLDDLDLVEILDKRFPGTGQQLTNVLQLPQLLTEDKTASPAMIAVAVRDDFAALERTDLESKFNRPRRRLALLAIGSLIAGVVAFSVLAPGTASLWARRWFAGSNLRWPQRHYLALMGLGDADRLLVPRGEAVLLQLQARPEFAKNNQGWVLRGRGTPLFVETLPKPDEALPENVSIKYRNPDRSTKLGTFTHFSAGEYRYELLPLTEPIEISITGGDDWFGPVRVEPIERPAIDDLTIIAHAPGKSEPQKIDAGNTESQLLFLPTTRLEVTLESNQPLTSAQVVFQGGPTPAPQLQRVDDRHYRIAWEMSEPATLEFQLVGRVGNLSSKPHFLSIGLLNDRPPRLTLRSSGVGKRVTPTARVPLHLRALDDFGIAELALELEESQIVDSQPKVATHRVLEEKLALEAAEKKSTDIQRDPTVELAKFQLAPGHTFRVRSLAVDACVLGPQSGESRWLSFQVVSPQELFYEVLTRQREQRAKFTKALEQAKEQVESLKKLVAPSDGPGLARVHQAVARQVLQVAVQLDASLVEMTLNDLGSDTARQLMETNIIKPLRDLHATEFVEARAKLDALVATPTIDEVRREEALVAQNKLAERMQRILDQMSQWESFVDVVNQLRHIMSSQNDILESTEKNQKERIDDIFDE